MVLAGFLMFLFQAEGIQQTARNITTFGKDSIIFELEAFRTLSLPWGTQHMQLVSTYRGSEHCHLLLRLSIAHIFEHFVTGVYNTGN